MGQVLQADSVAVISVTSTTVVTMAASVAQTIGGQQFPTSAVTVTIGTVGAGGLDTGSITANTLYHLYLVRASSVISLVASLNATSPTGFAAFKRIGRASTNASSQWVAAGNNVAEDTGKIGQILSAMLSESQFQAIHGSSWILSDGRSVAGSSYAITTGSTTVPDLRGLVLRGKNNGRVDGAQDPDGDRTLGSFQDHTFASHNHGGGNHNHGMDAVTRTSTENVGGGGNQVEGLNNGSATSVYFSGDIIGTQGGNETRMRNVAVNHFIKIN